MNCSVTIAVPTFRRNHHLRQLLPMLNAHADVVKRDLDLDTSILVIDNDPAGGARKVVDEMRFDNTIEYVVEPEPGLSAVRNRALDESKPGTLLAFIDDDCRPGDQWLAELVKTWQRAGSVAVVGRVTIDFEAPPDSWILAGGFFDRDQRPTMTPITAAPTTNLLLDVDQVSALGLRFDQRFGLSGGEDTLFTTALSARGGLMVWCNESDVKDQVPSSRLSKTWVLARARSHGNSTARVALALAEGSPRELLATRAKLAVGGTMRWASGTARWAAGLLGRSQRHQARGLRLAYRGIGMLYGAFGGIDQEYARRR